MSKSLRWCGRMKSCPYLLLYVLVWVALYTVFPFHAEKESNYPKSNIFDDRIYKARIKHLKNTCRHSEKGNVREIYLHEESKLAYCPVAKIGSTFWKRVFLYLHNDTGKHHAKTPFQIPREFVHYGTKIRTQVMRMNAINQRKMLSNYTGTRFMFVRDPYSRLWSTYLDKFYLPDFWRSYALTVVNKRIAPTENAKKCGNDVSFEEFLEYVASLAPVNMNEHWQPVKQKCDPCLFRPHILGKQETFSDDTRYILNSIGQGWIMEAFNSDVHVEEEISMLTDYNFRLINGKFYRNCTDKFDIARRLWKVFQLNGYLPLQLQADDAVMKLTNIHLDSVSFKQYVLETYWQYPASERKLWKQQRKETIREVYGSISKLLLKQIQELYRDDFKMFGYAT